MLFAISTGFGFMGIGTLLIQRIIPIFGTPYLAATVVISALPTGSGVISFILGTKGIGWKGTTILSPTALLVVPATPSSTPTRSRVFPSWRRCAVFK